MTRFSDLALDPRVLQAVAEAGYETPTPIQAQAIPEALKGRDVLGIAQTGTGKTASFTLPMITLLGQGRARARMPRSLVLAPTRELAAQVAENFDIYARHTKLTKALLIGGVAFGEQDKLIDRGVDVLIATPGRLLDHFERGKLLLTGVQIMVVDEADRMLDMGFIPDIERIFQLTPFTRQTMFYSATMAPEIERITNTFLTNPAKIEVARQATTSTTITQGLIEVKPVRKDRGFGDKRACLRALIRAEGEACTNAIIFCNRKMERMKTLDAFRDGTLHLLVASDVAARGLDIPAVSHVFNFDVPSHPEDYVHRIGRTGRAGRLGKAFTISVPSDEKYLKAIESLIKAEIPRVALPDGFEPGEDDGRPERPREERKGRDRAGRGRERERPVKPHDEVAAMEPVVVAAREEAAVAEPVEPRRDERREDRRADRRDRNGARPDARGEARPEQRGDRRDDRRDHRRDRDLGPAVVGMGDHVPDFILRSFALKAAPTDEVEDAVVAGEG
jgi:superfamily II DNA/RNA helicase